MSNTLSAGLVGAATTTVTNSNIAATMKSGSLAVFATPAMCALMEEAALHSVAPYLAEGEGTVGTKLCVSHDAATPLGMNVRAESELVEIDRRRLVFNVSAYDECGLIGKGTHERFIINGEKFLAKVNAKKAAE